MGTLLVILLLFSTGLMLYSKFTENKSGSSSANKSKNIKTGNQIQITDNMLIIVHPITGLRLQVANQDFSLEMTWPEAKKACNDLGNGWRLPTKEELEAMYTQLHKKGLGPFQSNNYWSSAEVDYNDAWFFSFFAGWHSSYSKNETSYVRAVRAL
jgi:hypothetical protein